MENKVILLISPESWGPVQVSKHHYARYLSKKNKVYFLNPAIGFKPNPFWDLVMKIHSEDGNLSIVTYFNMLPRLNLLPKIVQRIIYERQAGQIHKILKIIKFDLIWSFDPFRFWNFDGFVAGIKIYHSVDFHPKAKFERIICAKADIVFAVSNSILDKLKPFNSNNYKIPHGSDIDGFKSFHINKPVVIPGINKCKACYIGNINREIDYDVLLQLANENLFVDFILIGPYKANNLSLDGLIESNKHAQLSSLKNLYFLGPIPAHELIYYLDKMDINLVLFKKHISNSHKLMGYFYSGKVIVSSFIEEYNSGFKDMIVMTMKNNEISKVFKKIALNLDYYNSELLKSKRLNFALESSYDNLIKKIENYLYLR